MNKGGLWAAALALVLYGSVFAHARLQATIPAAGSEVKAPQSLVLKFNEEVRLATLTVAGNGKPVPVEVDRGAPAARELAVSMPPLAPGRYQVEWTVMSSRDGHVVKGRFEFSVAG